MTVWAGIDYLEKRATTIRNRLVYIVIDGPDAKSPQYIDEAIKFVGDLRSMKAPRGRAKTWQKYLVMDLEGLLSRAIDVHMGRVAPRGRS